MHLKPSEGLLHKSKAIFELAAVLDCQVMKQWWRNDYQRLPQLDIPKMSWIESTHKSVFGIGLISQNAKIFLKIVSIT